jgi:hypothetical protein
MLAGGARLSSIFGPGRACIWAKSSSASLRLAKFQVGPGSGKPGVQIARIDHEQAREQGGLLPILLACAVGVSESRQRIGVVRPQLRAQIQIPQGMFVHPPGEVRRTPGAVEIRILFI